MLDPAAPNFNANNEITTTYAVIRDKFADVVENERNKYPLTIREQMFVDVITELLGVLDYSVRSQYNR